MARKPAAGRAAAARRPPNPLTRLAELAGRGTSPDRMRREVEGLVATRLTEAGPDGQADLRDWLEGMRDQLAEGVEAGREAMDDMDRDDRAALAASQRALAALEAARDAFGQAFASLRRG